MPSDLRAAFAAGMRIARQSHRDADSAFDEWLREQPVVSVAGFDRAPDRYMGQERETIDRMRDRCWWRAGMELVDTARGPDDPRIRALANLLFEEHCELTALKYRDRSGRKDDPAAEKAKALWYEQMALHVADPVSYEDPRAGRPGFTPYVRHPWKG